MRRTLLAITVVAMVTLAGCAGTGPTADTAPTDTVEDASTDTADQTDDNDDRGSDTGIIAFYISDEANDIGDFRHLNATVTEVQFHYAGTTTGDELMTTDVTGTTEAPAGTDAPETTTVVATTAAPGAEGQGQAEGNNDNAERDPDEANEDETEAAETAAAEAVTDDEEPEADGDDGAPSQAGWITRDINDTTVDLTALQGTNATLLENVSLPAGKYTQVRLVVSEVNGTLTDGSDQRVKLPSDRLKLNKPFTLQSGDTVDFVFDITVQQAGNSGKYILKPVAGESGTDQEIEKVDARADARDDDRSD